MSISYVTIMFTMINLAILFAIIVFIYKAIQGFNRFVNRNKEMEKKIDIILNKLENEEEK